MAKLEREVVEIMEMPYRRALLKCQALLMIPLELMPLNARLRVPYNQFDGNNLIGFYFYTNKGVSDLPDSYCLLEKWSYSPFSFSFKMSRFVYTV